MRVEGPEGSWWVELRDAGQLTGGDEDAWNKPLQDAVGAFDVAVEDGDDGMEVSADGLTMRPRERRKVKVPVGFMDVRRDVLLSRLITGWSFDHIPLPYAAAARSQLPLAVCRELDKATAAHREALDASGPDPKAATTATSLSGTGAA